MSTITAKEFASKLDTDARTARKFLRADAKANGVSDELPGKGNRYAIEAKQVRSLAKRFAAWDTARTVAAEDADAEGDAPDAE